MKKISKIWFDCQFLFRVICTGFLLLMLVPLSVKAQLYRAGIFHPQPRLCQQQLHVQRDLRILRLVYNLEKNSWSQPPWFYQQRKVNKRSGLDLKPNSWQDSGSREEWRRLLIKHLPQSSVSHSFSESPLLWLPSHPLQTLLAYSHLQSARLLPFFDTIPALSLAPNVADNPLVTEQSVENRCRWWQTEVQIEHASHQATEGWWYRLSFPQAKGRVELRGYRKLDTMWQDYKKGALEAILVEGEDLAPLLKFGAKTQLWGRTAGGQQWVLRPSDDKAIQPLAIRQALGLAIPKRAIADTNKKLVASTHFLGPLLSSKQSSRIPPLLDDAQQARIKWFEEDAERPSLLRIAVVAHPELENIARRISQSWQRNFRLRVVVLASPTHSFASNIPRVNFFLDVVDLNDGSMQKLLAQQLDKKTLDLPAWENELRQELPYIPLFQNSHYAFCKKSLGSACLKFVCPSCKRYNP